MKRVALLVVVILVVATGRPAAAEPLTYGGVIGPVTPTSMGIYLPADGELANLSPAQLARIEQALYARLPEWEAFVQSGAVDIKSTGGFGEHRHSSRGSILTKPLATDAWGQCQVQWSDVGGGSWMRGYAKTWSGTAQNLYVTVQFFKDGVEQAGSPTSNLGYGAITEAVTSWVWKWWHLGYVWTTGSYHTARDTVGNYHLGPNAACSISKSY